MTDTTICRTPHPTTGYRCGLYKWHREDGTPHRILQMDYPYSVTVRHLSQQEREWRSTSKRGDAMKFDPDYCHDGEPHDWQRATSDRRGEGLQCSVCGVTEAELDGETP